MLWRHKALFLEFGLALPSMYISCINLHQGWSFWTSTILRRGETNMLYFPQSIARQQSLSKVYNPPPPPQKHIDWWTEVMWMSLKLCAQELSHFHKPWGRAVDATSWRVVSALRKPAEVGWRLTSAGEGEGGKSRMCRKKVFVCRSLDDLFMLLCVDRFWCPLIWSTFFFLSF